MEARRELWDQVLLDRQAQHGPYLGTAVLKLT